MQEDAPVLSTGERRCTRMICDGWMCHLLYDVKWDVLLLEYSDNGMSLLPKVSTCNKGIYDTHEHFILCFTGLADTAVGQPLCCIHDLMCINL